MADEYSKSVAMIAADQDRRALSEAEARGYARGVEDAATYMHQNYSDYVWCKYAIRGIRALLDDAVLAKDERGVA